MALLSLITGPSRTEFKGKQDEKRVLLIDVTTSRTPTFSSEVTSNPVEDGPDVNDHVRPKPVVISIEGVISETPLNIAGSLRGYTGTLQGLATSAGGAVTSKLGGFASGAAALGAGYVGAALMQSSDKPSEVGRKYLEDLITQRTIFTITDKHRAYENMILTSLTFPEDQSTAGHLKFSATAQQINLVQADTVLIENISRGASHTAANKTKMGKQTADSAGPELTKRSSFLHKGLTAFKGIFGGG